MPGNWWTELETAGPAEADLAVLETREAELEQVVRGYLHDVGRAVQGMRGSVQTFTNIWRSIVLLVARGQTAEMQAGRQRLLDAVAHRLDLLRRTCALAGRLRLAHGPDAVPDPAVLLAEIAGMEELKAKVFDRWGTAEDLEGLAVRDYPLTTADLEQIAATHAPPAAWYEGEEEKLFQE